MRVLLVDPPYERFVGFRSEWFPMGLAYIGGYLKAQGHMVGIYNAEHGSDTEYKSVVKYAHDFNRYKAAIAAEGHPVWAEVKRVIDEFAPDVVGVSAMTPKFPAAIVVCSLAKRSAGRITTVMGGHHATIRPEEALAHASVDFVVRQEGELTLAHLLAQLTAPSPAFTDVPGLSFRKDGIVVHNTARPLVENLDSLGMPARELLINVDQYTPVQLGAIMTSRGCPFDCGFCASSNMWSRKVRFRSVAEVLREVRHLHAQFGVRSITFMDDSFTTNRHRIADLCGGLIDCKAGITWSCLTRADMVTPELIALMKRAGCRKVDIGIESGNDRVLRLIGKEITRESVRQAARILNDQGMFWSGFFMIGFPTETEAEIGDTLEFLREIRPGWANISIFTPYPGTALYNLAMERGGFGDFARDYTLYSHQNTSCRGTDVIPQERFGSLAERVLAEVHTYNSSLRSLMRRAATRDYATNPALLLLDARKAMNWLRR